METTEKAYAKLNLSLDVLSKMPDGYHAMEMVMVSAGLFDEIRIRGRKGGGIYLGTNVDYLPRDRRNIANQAASLFFAETGIRGWGLDMHILKRIPVCAGMGGGSSDAAAVLRGLNRLFSAGLSAADLQKMGAKIGSDVPYCVTGGTAFAQGRGEKLTPLDPMPPCHIVICKPNFPISTPELFGKIDCRRIPFRPQTADLVKAISEGDLGGISRRMYNVFEDIMPSNSPIHEIKGCLLDCGAIGAVMSGTGPSVFGIFDDLQNARNAYNASRSKFRDVFFTELINKILV